VASVANSVQVSACAEPGDSPCQSFYGAVVPTSLLRVEPVSGSAQVVSVGQAFAPVIVRVTDSATPPDAVLGASVVFQSWVMRPDNDAPIEQVGDTVVTSPAMPVILSSSKYVAISNGAGLATLQAATGVQTSAEVEGTATAGSSTLTYELEALATGGTGFSAARRTKIFAPYRGMRPRTTE
jgi:hypothetical protein